MDAGLFRKLALGTVFIQASHGKKAVGGNAARIVHGNKGIRIAGVADHQHTHILGGAAGNGLPLADEHLAVDIQQVLAFHTGLAGNGAYQQAPVGAGERFIRIAGRDNFINQRERGVTQLHHQPFQSIHGRGNFQQAQVDRLIRPQHAAGGNTEQKGIGNLAGGSCNGNGDRCFHNVQIKINRYFPVWSRLYHKERRRSIRNFLF